MENAIIQPPPHCHIFWSATRARRFARLAACNPKRRGTYDQNIRLLSMVYDRLTGTTEDGDPRLFMQKVNPIPFARMLGLEPPQIKRFLAGYWGQLNQRLLHSRCAHCRRLAI
jgi:hypothetical protein